MWRELKPYEQCNEAKENIKKKKREAGTVHIAPAVGAGEVTANDKE